MKDILQKKGVVRVKNFLSTLEPKIDLIILEETARTAKDAALSLNQKVGAIIKSIILKENEENFYLCLVSGDKYVSIDKVSYLIGNKLTKANADEVKNNTGYSIGGVAPFAHLKNPKKIFIDINLKKYNKIYAAAGHPHVVFGIDFDQLCRISKGEVIDIVE